MESDGVERSAISTIFPGFKFSPTDEELILYYLQKKLKGYDKCVEVIPQLDICKYEPWDLPSKSIIKSDEEWFFFSPRGKKYPNGSQSKRATEIGYWKATGKERAVKSGSNVIGTKRNLVFHIGRAPKGERTHWIMHEYCIVGNNKDSLVICRLKKKWDSVGMDGSHGREIVSVSQSSDPSMLMSTECSVKNSSSSHGSYSVEQIDTASKDKDEIVLQPQSTKHEFHVANEFEDELFAEILKDNIVELDEIGVTNTIVNGNEPINIMPRFFNNTHYQFAAHRVYRSQGTANRRVRLWKPRRINHHRPRKEDLKEGFGENMVCSSKLKPFPKDSNNNYIKKRGWINLPKNCSTFYSVLIAMALVILTMSYGTGPISYTLI